MIITFNQDVSKLINGLIAQATALRVRPSTHAKLLAFAQAPELATFIGLDPEEADEVSLALDQEFWKSLWDLLSIPFNSRS